MLDRQQDRLTGGELEARLIETGRMQPAQPVGEDQRKGHPQREVGLEEVEADEERLAVGFLERVDQRATDRFHEGPAGREGPDAERVLDVHLRELDVTHHRV